MRILMVNKFLFQKGGAETYVLQLGKQLERMGHEVQYFGMDHETRCVGNRVNSYVSEIDFHNRSSPFSKLTYPFKIIYSTQARKKIRLVLDDFQPDVIHLNNFNYQLTPSILLEADQWRKETGHVCRILYTAHDYQLVCPNHMCAYGESGHICEDCLGGHYGNCIKHKCIHNSTLRSIVGCAESTYWHSRQVYRILDTIICCSAFMKQKLDTNSILREKTVPLHNFSTLEKPRPAAKQDYVLYFGRYSSEKGIETLLKACKALPHIPFVFAGSGPLENEISGLPNVKNVGFQSGDALKSLIASARFSVYPSEWYENCPFSIMESIFYGTPVLGANIGGIPELINEDKTGELFNSGNVEDLIAHIRTLWDEPVRLAAYTQECARTTFDTVEQYAEKILPYYQS